MRTRLPVCCPSHRALAAKWWRWCLWPRCRGSACQLPPGIPLGANQQTPRLRSILEGLLEDRLLDDPAQLHFALQPGARAGSPVWVAVCDRSWLRDHLQALEAARPTRIARGT